MLTVGITEAKARFYELIARVEAGERILITRWGKPVAMLIPLGKFQRKRPAGR